MKDKPDDKWFKKEGEQAENEKVEEFIKTEIEALEDAIKKNRTGKEEEDDDKLKYMAEGYICGLEDTRYRLKKILEEK